METLERGRRNHLEQLQADAKARERTLASLEAEIASVTRDVEAAQRDCLSVEQRLAEVRRAVRAQVSAKSRMLARSERESAGHRSAEEDPGGLWGALGMGAIVTGFVPWEFHGLTSAHVFVAGVVLVFLGFFVSELFRGPSAEALSNVQ